MIQKFQQGGNAMMQFVLGLAQTLLANPDEVIQIAQLNPEALLAAVLIFQQTKDMGLAAKAFQLALQLKTQAMKHGAKLQYLKSLKNQCAEDEELYYYKKGGSVGCGCKKKEKGGEVTSESPITKFKKARKMLNGGKDSTEVNYPDPTEGGKKVYDKKTKTFRPVTSEDKNNWKKNLKDATQGKGEGIPERGGEPVKNYRNSIEKKLKKYEKKKCGGEMKPKLAKRGEKVCPKCGKVHSAKIGCTVAKFKMHRQGGSLNGIPFYQEGGKSKKKSINDYYLTDYSEPNILQKAKLNGKELTIKVNKGLQKGEDPITIQGNNYYLKGDSTLVKDNSIPYSFLQLRNAGINKKYNNGGSLNGIPFMQTGTPKGGINGRGINGEYYYNPVPYNAGEVVGTFPLIDVYNAIENYSKTSNNPYLYTGDAPGPVKAKNAWEALQMVKAMKAQKAAKTVSKVVKPKSIATGPKTIKLGNGYSAQIEVPDLPNYLELFDAYKMTKASRLNINNILDKLSPEERANVMKVMMYDPDKYLGRWVGNITPQRAASSITNIRRRLPGEYTPLRVKSLDLTRPNMGTGIFLKFDDATSKTAGFKRTTDKY